MGRQIFREKNLFFFVITPLPVSYESIETGEDRHIAEYISNKLCEVIVKVGSCKVFA